MMHKIRWTGPSYRIPDLAAHLPEELGGRVKAGDEFESEVIPGGEGVHFDVVGGDEFDALASEAKGLKVSGYTKMTRLELEEAVETAKADAEAKKKAEAEAKAEADTEESN